MKKNLYTNIKSLKLIQVNTKSLWMFTLIGFLCLNPIVLFSQSATWNGGGVDNNWTTADNWGGTAPVATNSLIFEGSTRLTPSNNFAAATNFAGITFNSGSSAFTLSGNSISLGADVTNNSSNLQTISIAMALTANRTFNTASGDITVEGVISGSGYALIKSGSNTLTLTESNTYNGGTSINEGTIGFSSSGNLSSGTITMSNGTTLMGTGGGSAVTFSNSFSLTSGTVTIPVLGGSSGKDVTLSGSISGSGGIIATSSGGGRWLMLNGAKTFSGGVTMSGSSGGVPTIRINNSTSLGSGTLTSTITSTDFARGLLQPLADLSSGSGVTNGIIISGSSARLSVSANGSGNLQLSGIISGSGYLVKVGTATLTLSGTNTFSGGVKINDGTLSVATIGNGGVAGNLGQAANAAANLVLDEATLSYTGATASTDRNFTLAASTTSTINISTNTLTISGASTSTSGALTKTGSGTLTLTGGNLYTGLTTVSAGTLQLNKTGGTTIPITNNMTIDGGTLKVSSDQTLANLTLSSGTLVVDAGVTLIITGTYTDGTASIDNLGTIILQGGSSQTFPGSSTTIDNGTSGEMTNLTINNSNGVSLDKSFTIAGALILSSGKLAIGESNTLTLNGTFSGSASNSLTGSATSSLIIGAAVGTVYFDNSSSTTQTLQYLTIGTGSTTSMTLGSALNIAPAGNITFNASGTKSLTINGQTLTLQSDASGTASVGNTNSTTITGNISAERYISVVATAKNHHISSPISNGTVSSILGSASYGNYNAYEFDISSQSFVRVFSANAMTPAKGYVTGYDHTSSTPLTNSFTGNMNTGTVSPTISSTNNQWNLIGNPYPCAIDLTNATNGFLRSSNNPNINGTAYFWIDDATGGSGYSTADYGTINSAGSTGSANSQTPTAYLGSGQGFFVQSNSSGSSVSFTEAMKVSGNNTQFFIPDPVTYPKFTLSVTDSKNNYNEILIAFIDDATEGFDSDYDGRKLKGNTELAFYSLMKDDLNGYSIQSFSSFINNRIIQLGLDANVGGNYIIKLNETENFGAQKIYLKDRLLNITVNLNDVKEYTFTSPKGSIKSRFEIQFTGTTGISESDNIEISIFPSSNSINIINPFYSESQVQIFDMLGKSVYSSKLNTGFQSINPGVISGYYLVKIQSDMIQHTEKVFLK
ncbi:MAG: autotransporter-associated beta strand repeat-containing protein [Bacteroidetes bacterium]|nr:autotransporter-associated beta strand repeat-containing protein [Bacteroidota bacterium]